MMVFLSGCTFCIFPRRMFLVFLEKMKKRLKNSGLLYIAVKEKKEKWSRGRNKKEDDYGYEYERFLVIIH